MGDFCNSHRRIADHIIALSQCRIITDHTIADRCNSLNYYVLFMRCYDMRCRISAIGDFLRFNLWALLNVCDAMNFASLFSQYLLRS